MLLLTCYFRNYTYLSLQETHFAIILALLQTFGIKVFMVAVISAISDFFISKLVDFAEISEIGITFT